MKDKSRLFFNSILVFIATIIENFIFFIINVIIARYLSIEHFGEYTTALGYATFFSTITNIGINQTLIRATNLFPEKQKENFSSAFFIKCILGILIYSIMACSLYFTNYHRELVYLTLVMGVFRIGNEFLTSFYSFFDAKETFILSSAFKIIFSVSFLLLTIGVVFCKGGLFYFAYVRLWLVVFFIFVLILTSSKLITFHLQLMDLYNFFIESIPFGIFTIFGNIYQRTNVIFLSLIHGSIYTGVFSNGFIFFTTLFFIPQNLSRVLLPYLYKVSFKSHSSKFQFAFDVYTKYLTLISFYLTMCVIFYAKEVIYLIFTDKYQGSIIILQIISIGIPFVFTIAPTLITSLDKQPILTKIYLYGFIINITSNIMLIYFFKSEGAAITAVITYGYIFVASTYYLVKNKFINASCVYNIFISQIIIILFCYLVKVSLLKMNWILSLIVISGIWIILNFIFVINKNDVRILKEIFNRK